MTQATRLVTDTHHRASAWQWPTASAQMSAHPARGLIFDQLVSAQGINLKIQYLYLFIGFGQVDFNYYVGF